MGFPFARATIHKEPNESLVKESTYTIFSHTGAVTEPIGMLNTTSTIKNEQCIIINV